MDEVLARIFEAGIVGCGGAGFPTHAKLDCKPEYLLVNGAECEPLLRSDRFIMLQHAQELVAALLALKESLGHPKCVIALKDTYVKEIGSLKAAISECGADLTLCLLQSFYPAGDEHTIVYEATGRVVPSAGIPLDVGCVVTNASTVYNVYNALRGVPFTRRTLTVTGAVKKPAVMDVPVGTPFAECVAHAGGTTADSVYYISGGPMMGRKITQAGLSSEFVQKTTSGILVLPLVREDKISLDHMKNRAKCSCIQCTYCTELCPRHLLGHPIEPHKIMRKLAFSKDLDSLLNEPGIVDAALCCECGVCEIYACPMGLQPRAVNAVLKKELAKRGVRFPKGQGMRSVSDYRDGRKIPSKRAASRAGVLSYYDNCPADICAAYGCGKVTLLLKQHIGAPSLPVVKTGERVEEGQLVAKCPDGALGANLHASIAGTAEVLADRIIITGETL